MLWWPAMKAGSTAMTQRPRDRVPSGSMRALPDLRRPDRANPPTNFWWSLFLTALARSTSIGFPLDRQSIRNTTLSSGRDSVGRGQHSSNLIIGISTMIMHQSTTPFLSQTIWPRWAPRQLLSLPIVQTLLPVTFAYSLKLKENLRGCRYVTIEEMKEAVTKIIDTLTQEDFHGAFRKLLERYNKCIWTEGITSKRTRVSCVYYQ